MRLSSRLIVRYIVKAITPYLLLGLLLLTMILLIQQSGRFAPIFTVHLRPSLSLNRCRGSLVAERPDFHSAYGDLGRDDHRFQPYEQR